MLRDGFIMYDQTTLDASIVKRQMQKLSKPNNLFFEKASLKK